MQVTEITASEWEVMRMVWTLKTTHADQVIRELQAKNKWSASTIKTLLRRLVNKNFLKTEKDGRRFIYQATVSQSDMMYLSLRSSLSRMCDMDKGKVMTRLLSDIPLSKQDISKIQKELSDRIQRAPEQVPCNCLPDGRVMKEA